MLKLTSVQDLQKLIEKTDSLDEKEKQVLLKLIPIMRSEDLDRIYTVLTMEDTVVANLPSIIDGIKTNLINMHDKTIEGYNLFENMAVKEAKDRVQEEEKNQAEKLIDEL